MRWVEWGLLPLCWAMGYVHAALRYREQVRQAVLGPLDLNRVLNQVRSDLQMQEMSNEHLADVVRAAQDNRGA